MSKQDPDELERAAAEIRVASDAVRKAVSTEPQLPQEVVRKVTGSAHLSQGLVRKAIWYLLYSGELILSNDYRLALKG